VAVQATPPGKSVVGQGRGAVIARGIFMSPSMTPLSQAEILREAEMIREAVGASPLSPRADILSQVRELDADDEERVVQVLEELSRQELE
jgi:hypothetical protein